MINKIELELFRLIKKYNLGKKFRYCTRKYVEIIHDDYSIKTINKDYYYTYPLLKYLILDNNIDIIKYINKHNMLSNEITYNNYEYNLIFYCNKKY